MAHNTYFFCSFGDVKEKNHRSKIVSLVLTSMTLHLNLISNLVRESVPRQIDKKSMGPQGERGLEFSRRKTGQTFFPSTFLRIMYPA